jgi:DinB superfamily
MMTHLLSCFLLVLPFAVNAQVKQTVWTSADRQYLLDGLKSTQADIISVVEPLNEKQLHFKPDSSQWSIAEVVEHVGVYEELLYWDLLNNQFTEERPDLVDSVAGKDAVMKAYATDPAKGQAPFAAQPLGRFGEKAELLHFFNRSRNEVIKMVQETNVDFRLHFIFRPPDWGVWHIRDLHQYTLLWIAHTERHLNQIERIKNNPHFPH